MDLLRIRQKIKMEESRDTDENDGSRISKSLSRLLPLKTKIPEYCEVISEPIEVKNIAPRLQVKASNCFQVASLAVLIVSVLGATKCLAVQPNNDVFTDQFVMQMPGGANLARQTAEKHGFIFLGQVRRLPLRLPVHFVCDDCWRLHSQSSLRRNCSLTSQPLPCDVAFLPAAAFASGFFFCSRTRFLASSFAAHVRDAIFNPSTRAALEWGSPQTV